MCNPLLISAALMAAGTGAQYAGARQADKARASAMLAERIRQQGFDEQARAVSDEGISRYEGASTAQTDKRSALEAEYASAPSVAPTAMVMPASNSNVTVNATNERVAEESRFGDQQDARRANLRSFGDFMTDFSRQDMRDAGEVGQISRFKQGSSNVLPWELDAANHKGQGLRNLGQLLSMAGNAGMGFALGPATAGASGAAQPLMSAQDIAAATAASSRPSSSLLAYGLY